MKNYLFSRADFLKTAGLGAAVAFTAAGCNVDSIPPPEDPGFSLEEDPRPDNGSIYLGAGDTGLFNLIYAVEQLLAAFFTTVTENFYDGITEEEQRILNDIQQHEVAHRDFFAALLGDAKIQSLDFDFSDTAFASKNSVLQDASFFENTSVSMYNNLGQFLVNGSKYINIILPVASVEARHAAAVMNLIAPDSTLFISEGIITDNGLDIINRPVDLVSVLGPFFNQPLDINNIPR